MAASIRPIAAKDRIGHHRRTRILEIRSYELKPRTRDEYDRLFIEEAAPRFRRLGIDVVAAGASIGNPNGYYLMRAFDDLDDRTRRENAFYSLPEWRKGPRRAVLDCIETYSEAVIELDETMIEALRRSLSRD